MEYADNPWFVAQSIDHYFAQDNPWIAQIHSLCITCIAIIIIVNGSSVAIHPSEIKCNIAIDSVTRDRDSHDI